jgi:hypothetical protein
MSKPLPPIIAYELEFKPGIAQVDGSREWGLEYIHIHAHHAGGEPLKMFYENDGIWRQRLADIFGDAEALAVMTQLEMGEPAKVPGTFTSETLKALKFHRDLLKIA